MTGIPPEEREPRDDTAVLPTPGPKPPASEPAPSYPPPTWADGLPVAEVVPLPPPPGPRPQGGYHPAYQPPPQTAPHAYGAPTPGQVRPVVGGGHVAVAWVVAVLTLGYMLPWAVAATRGRDNTLAIALLNLLVGWTFIGWVAALVMACLSNATQPGSPTFIQVNPPAPSAPAPGWYPDGRGGSQYWDGRGWASGPR